MKVTQALMFAVMAFQANAFLDSQETNQEVTQTGGAGGAGGDNTQEGGNGGSAAQSTGGAGGAAGDASGGQGSQFQLNANHQIAAGMGGSSASYLTSSPSCYGSCNFPPVTQTTTGGNGGAASDNSNFTMSGNIANTDSSGGNSVGGDGGQSGAQGDGGDGSQTAASSGGDGAAGNDGGANQGGDNDNQNSSDLSLPLDVLPGPLRRYAPGAYEKRNAGLDSE